MMVLGGKLAVGAAALFLGAQQCASFQICNDFVTRRSGCGSALYATVAEESSSPEVSLDPEAIRLKDDLVALAAATRRGVSGFILCT